MKKRFEVLNFGRGQVAWIVKIWYDIHEHESGNVELPYEVHVTSVLLINERGVKLGTTTHVADEMMYVINWATEMSKPVF